MKNALCIIAAALGCYAGISHAATDALPDPLDHSWHITVTLPGSPPEEREVNGRFTLTYKSRLVEFNGALPDSSAKALPADEHSYKLLGSPNFHTANNSPSTVASHETTAIVQETVSGTTKTLRSVPVSLGYTVVVDPFVSDPNPPVTVRTRVYLEHTVMAEGKAGKSPVSVTRKTDELQKAGDKQLITWSLDGHNYGLELELASITDNAKK
ncbi:hypothetical protein [Pseudomonas sp.]|uniref:hypothetical protein n=1 Tax=Pseudomonas sp. TaxID=306 RepID=UPI0029148247|nr:hypothetical protein [Pseudomonas sp.]MDU4254540.1 hypothetical protein [Pseudomonas sp.]